MVVSEGIGIAINLMKDIFTNTTFLGSTLIFQFAIVIATLLLITRDWSEWGELLLPVMVGWRIAGMYVSTLFMFIAGVIFVISTLSMKTTGGFVGIARGIHKQVGEGNTLLTRRGRLKSANQRIDIQSSMRKLTSDLDEKRIKEFYTSKSEGRYKPKLLSRASPQAIQKFQQNIILKEQDELLKREQALTDLKFKRSSISERDYWRKKREEEAKAKKERISGWTSVKEE